MTISRLLPTLVALASAPLLAMNEGMATHFLGVGYPYGACGVSDEVAATEGAMDTLTGQGNPFDYVALNVFDTPKRYDMPASRPMTGSDTVFIGAYDNGRNCGRWIRFELGDTCDGANDGAAGKEFCRGGTGWHPNAYTGSGGYAIVFDQCTDGNAWCRDSKWHLDLHTPILGRLRKDGQLLPPMAWPVLDASGKPQADANNPWSIFYQVSGFLNPKISWEFVPAPNYQGEPRFYFSVDSKSWYYRVIVTHLENGIHGVEQLVGTEWKPARMEGDMGQLWILPDPSTKTVTLRITDAHDKPVMAGRTWTMDFPTTCGTVCTKPATPAENVVGKGGEVASASARPAAGKLVRIGNRLLFPGQGSDRQATWISPNGTRVPMAIHQGMADIPRLARGAWTLTWKAPDGSAHRSHLIVP